MACDVLKMRFDSGEKIAGRQSRPTVDLSVRPLGSASVRPSRVFAMARPRKPAGEGVLVEHAAGELGLAGSRRYRAVGVAKAVAALAVAQITLDELEAVMAKGEAIYRTPALAALAFGEEAFAAEIVVQEAIAAFQRRGCRHTHISERSRVDRELKEAVVARLSERYRRS